MAAKLDAGDVLPQIALELTDGTTLVLPDQLETAYGVVLFYRGYW